MCVFEFKAAYFKFTVLLLFHLDPDLPPSPRVFSSDAKSPVPLFGLCSKPLSLESLNADQRLTSHFCLLVLLLFYYKDTSTAPIHRHHFTAVEQRSILSRGSLTSKRPIHFFMEARRARQCLIQKSFFFF